jgi:NADH dehydrogenase (ubiquinone) 1 alpha/beta subcomplex 1
LLRLRSSAAVSASAERGKAPRGAQVTASAHFQKDLGLDSLDTVEVVMAFEEEFAVEIPDSEADKIMSASDAINYISAHPHAK